MKSGKAFAHSGAVIPLHLCDEHFSGSLLCERFKLFPCHFRIHPLTLMEFQRNPKNWNLPEKGFRGFNSCSSQTQKDPVTLTLLR